MTMLHDTPPTAAVCDYDAQRHRRLSDPWAIATALFAALLTLTVAWTVLYAGLGALDSAWIPSGDWALLTLRVEDVGIATPLVGPYSRFGWNHPGPLVYWLLAPPYHFFGNGPDALLTAAALLNALTVCAVGVVSWRRGRLPLVACTMIAVAVLLHAMGPTMIRDPWNPFLTLLPLFLIVLLAWSVLERDHWMWPVLAFYTSFELQSHIGYLPILLSLSAVVILISWRQRSFRSLLPDSPRARWWVVGSSVAVVVACWFAVVVDQFVGTGNLGAIVRYFLSPGDQPAGFGTALHLAADQLQFPAAPWLGRTELAGTDGALLGAGFAALFIPILAMAATLWLALRTRAFTAVRFQCVAIASAFGGILATARVLGPLFDWIVRWWWVIACLWWLSIVWALWCVAMTHLRSSRLQRIATGALAAVALVIVLAATGPVRAATGAAPLPNPSTGVVLNGFLQPVLSALEGSGPLLVVTTGSVRGDYGDAIRLQLERAGIRVVGEQNMITRLGPERSVSNRTADGTLWIVSADAISQFFDYSTMRYLGGWDPLTPEQRAQFFVDQAHLQDQLIAAGRIDLAEALTNGTGGVDTAASSIVSVNQDLLQQVEATRRKGDPVAVFLGPAR
ncbi:MAG: hypothetical protein WEA11_09000 [Acidimicrobiales bacterium]